MGFWAAKGVFGFSRGRDSTIRLEAAVNMRSSALAPIPTHLPIGIPCNLSENEFAFPTQDSIYAFSNRGC